MLEITGLRVQYGDTVALDGVDLTVADREVVCVLGPSGSGKSTLLRATAGLERPTAGRCAGTATTSPASRRTAASSGSCSRTTRCSRTATCSATSRSGCACSADRAPAVDAGRARGARTGRARTGSSTGEVRELSGGEQQRVALARALAPDPRLLMLDEPLGSLDRELRERLAAELRALFVALGVTALFVTHDQDEAFALADRVVIMRSGTIEQVGAAAGGLAPSGDRVRGPVPRLRERVRRDRRRPAASTARGACSLARPAWPTAPARSGSRPGPTGCGSTPTVPVRGRVTGATFRRDHFLVRVETELGPLEVAADAAPARRASSSGSRSTPRPWWSLSA